MTNNNLPNPSGKKFYDRFKLFMNVKGIPYMTPEALDKDINLYHGMLIVLSYSLGVTKIRLQDDKRYDSISPAVQDKAVARRAKDYENVRSFLSSSAMVSLKDNEYTNRPENSARKECYDFLKNAEV